MGHSDRPMSCPINTAWRGTSKDVLVASRTPSAPACPGPNGTTASKIAPIAWEGLIILVAATAPLAFLYLPQNAEASRGTTSRSNDAIPAERGDLGLAVSKFGENFVRMLAYQRRRTIDPSPIVRQAKT